MIREFVGDWRLVAVRGVAAVLFGLATLIWPDVTLWVLVVPRLARCAEDRFHVDDRGAVDGLEIGYPHPEPVDREHPNSVQTDWIGPVGGTSAEDTGQGVPRIIARMYG